MQQHQEKMSENEMEGEDDDFSQGYLEQVPLQVLELLDVMQIIKETIESVMEKCDKEKVSLDNLIELFQYFDWNKDKVEQNYFSNQDELLQNLQAKGIWNNHCQIAYQTQAKQACPVCLEENYLIQLGCLHKFCQNCIEQTIQQKVEKEHSLIIRCLQVGCIYRIPFSIIEKYCKPKDFSYELCKKFVENSQLLVYCPGVDCKKVLYKLISNVSIVTCSSYLNEYCFTSKIDHSPVPCDLVKKQIHQITKDEANIRWIALNTKICPFCQKPVEKSSGCNQLHCKRPGGCGGTFCYVCGKSWEPDHKNHFKCNTYVAKQNDQEKEKTFLAIYNFYYKRFLNSEQNYKQIQNKLKELNSSIINKQKKSMKQHKWTVNLLKNPQKNCQNQDEYQNGLIVIIFLFNKAIRHKVQHQKITNSNLNLPVNSQLFLLHDSLMKSKNIQINFIETKHLWILEKLILRIQKIK